MPALIGTVLLAAMSPGGGGDGGGGGGSSSSCTSVSLGKFVRRVLRGGGSRKLIKDKNRPRRYSVKKGGSGGASSVELVSSSSSALAAERLDSVVRVILWSGFVEMYDGVTLASTVIRNHPPGLCLAHPDVFRNPHGAMIRPGEPLFPGQKFFLLPATTIEKLCRHIPEGSVGAFDDDEEEEEAMEGASSSWDKHHGDGAASSSDDEEWERRAAPLGGDEDDGRGLGVFCARGYYEDRDRWSESHTKKPVARAGAPRTEPRRKKKPERQRNDRHVAAPSCPGPECGTSSRAHKTSRSWEPSLPSVVEEEEDKSPVCSECSLNSSTDQDRS